MSIARKGMRETQSSVQPGMREPGEPEGPEMDVLPSWPGGNAFPAWTCPRPLSPEATLDDLADRVCLPGGEETVHPSQKHQKVQRYRT